MADPVTVELTGTAGKQTLTLHAPASMATRYEAMYAAADSEPKAVAAALGLANAKLARAAGGYRHNVLDFGRRVIDYLLEQGVPYLDVLNAGRVAWRDVVCGDLLPSASEVEKIEGFSGATPGGSTS